jgi:hypothetical protein
MNAKTLLTSARRFLVEKEWTQGDWATITKSDGSKTSARLVNGKLMIEKKETWDPVTRTYQVIEGKVVPVSKVEAVCAMGAIELALANKDYDGPNTSETSDPVVIAARQLLEQAIAGAAPDLENEYLLERYEEYVDETRRYDGPDAGVMSLEEFALETQDIDGDGVEGWNDAPGRTKREVIEAFDRAIALA